MWSIHDRTALGHARRRCVLPNCHLTCSSGGPELNQGATNAALPLLLWWGCHGVALLDRSIIPEWFLAPGNFIAVFTVGFICKPVSGSHGQLRLVSCSQSTVLEIIYLLGLHIILITHPAHPELDDYSLQDEINTAVMAEQGGRVRKWGHRPSKVCPQRKRWYSRGPAEMRGKGNSS